MPVKDIIDANNPAGSNAPSDSLRLAFEDAATYDPVEKTAISVRDGVLEYLGHELSIEPADKIFTVYRSPATIANAAYKMVGIPLTDEHVSLDMAPPETGSRVDDTGVIDLYDENTETRIGVRNKLSLSDTAVMMLDNKRQLSLGYFGDLVPHDKYDFEQINIIPHHLAAVPAGRCGTLCSFLDRKPQPTHGDKNMPKLNKAFLDAEGSVSLEEIVEIATSLPEAIKAVPLDKLGEVMPALMEIMSYAKSQGVETTDEDEMGEEPKEKEPMQDMGEEEDKPAFADAVAVIGVNANDAEELKKAFEDAQRSFADKEIELYSGVVSKARDFVDAAYEFTGKTAKEIMRDAIATQSTEKFEDSELTMAFKMLRKSDNYKQFGDGAKAHPLDEIGDKELN